MKFRITRNLIFIFIGAAMVGAGSWALSWLGLDGSAQREYVAPADKSFVARVSSYLYSSPADYLPLSSGAYAVYDLGTGETILQKNQDQILPIASVTKLVTVLASRELLSQDRQVEITRSAWETYGNTGNFRIGEKLPLAIITQSLLLTSSNDAAEAIAETAGRERFINKMNEVAKKIGMKDTNFVDPSGLSPHNVSTPADLVKLVQYIHEKEPDIFEITSAKSYRYKYHTWSNLNRVSLMKYYQGGKNGYTDEAKRTLVSLFEVPISATSSLDKQPAKENRLLAVVLLQSDDNRKDTKNLLNYLDRYVAYTGGKNGFIPVTPLLN